MKKIYYLISEQFNENDVRVYEKTPTSLTWPTKSHSHEYMQIWYVVKGSFDHIVDKHTYHLEETNLLIIPPQISHDIKNASQDCIIYGCEFPVEILIDSSNLKENDGKKRSMRKTYYSSFEEIVKKTIPCFIPSISCNSYINRRFTKMIEIYKNKSVFFELELKAEVYLLFISIYRDYFNSEKETIDENHKNDIEKVVKYINENYTQKLYINDVAEIALMCPSYFSFFFSKIMGCSFVDYVNTLRINKAKELLIDTRLSIEEISEKVGYNNVTYFNRVFKTYEGYSPNTHRKINSNKNI